MPKGVIFDIDGTLVDSNDAHAAAWMDAFREFGFTHIPPDRVRWMIGMGGDKILPELTDLTEESERGKKLLDRRKEIFLRSYLPTLHPFPSARELVEKVRAEGMTAVIASSANEAELGRLLDVAGVRSLMDATTSSSDAENSKPDPDIVYAAIRSTGFAASQLVMVGDTPYDVEAALRAGVPIVALRSGGWNDSELDGALRVYADPEDLLGNFDASPLANPRDR